MDSLGKTLKAARELASLTLREVEELTAISNAYLSQVENDKIKKPSASVLYKLSRAYKVPLERFLAAAGIIEDYKPHEVSFFTESKILSAENITEKEEEELMKYLRYLRYQSTL
ncbi:helix-turn-helix transcriptional regulator [Chitinophaga pollutisoli]|uniref:Helix-turn-helix transcriptional regulator n=1 Tax=Chitinophaga pollutisoli TaxID=3133966 RepID=A0ABZ2YR84_9BACT